MLTLDQLVCKRDERSLFEPVSLRVEPGQCVELLGANGAGKSTLLRTLAGIHSQFDGAYTCADFLYQGHRLGLDELLCPIENLRWYASVRGVELAESRLRETLERVGMLGDALTPTQQLSQGQQRRVAMARWLLASAELWLLDEPYTALDQAGQGLLNEVIEDHCDGGGAVFCATHTPLTVDCAEQFHLTPLAGRRTAGAQA